jgi:flagella basal body P-ring formation protein FlgA
MQRFLVQIHAISAVVIVILLVTGAARAESMEARIKSQAVAFLSQKVSLPHDSLAVDIGLPPIHAGADKIADFGFDLLSAKPVVGTVPFRITLFLHDGTAKPLTATARVHIYDTVVVSTRRLQRHEALSPDDLRLERREVTYLPDGYFTDPDLLLVQRTRRVISTGTVLIASAVEVIPLIKRGSGVSVSVIIGSVIVTSRAKALEDGGLGETIKIQDIGTRKRLSGVVAGQGLVVLDSSAL